MSSYPESHRYRVLAHAAPLAGGRPAYPPRFVSSRLSYLDACVYLEHLQRVGLATGGDVQRDEGDGVGWIVDDDDRAHVPAGMVDVLRAQLCRSRFLRDIVAAESISPTRSIRERLRGRDDDVCGTVEHWVQFVGRDDDGQLVRGVAVVRKHRDQHGDAGESVDWDTLAGEDWLPADPSAVA